MKLSAKALQVFKKLYRKQYGVELNDEQANEKGVYLLSLLQLVYIPIPHLSKK